MGTEHKRTNPPRPHSPVRQLQSGNFQLQSGNFQLQSGNFQLQSGNSQLQSGRRRSGTCIRFSFCAPLLLVVILSCSFDYEEAMVDENLAEEFPESIMLELSQTVVEGGKTILKLEADSVEIYQGHKKTVARGLHFLEFDNDGNALTEGWADEVVYFNETEDAEFTGNVYFYSKKEEISISTDSIRWESERRYLETPPETRVTLKKDDGSFLEGVGLEADLRRMEIRLKGGVRGRYVTEEE